MENIFYPCGIKHIILKYKYIENKNILTSDEEFVYNGRDQVLGETNVELFTSLITV